jgi:hypothetical protein
VGKALTILACWLVVAGACVSSPAPEANVVLFEGTRLIVGDERAPIENAAFVVEDGTFTHVGHAGDVQVPAGAARVNLAGKTVMPAIIDAHGHLGYRKGASFLVENYTRDNILDHLQRLAYHGVAAVMSMGAERPEGYALRDELRVTPPPNLNAIRKFGIHVVRRS